MIKYASLIVCLFILSGVLSCGDQKEVTLSIGESRFVFPKSVLKTKGFGADIEYDTYSPVRLKWEAREIQEIIPEYVNSVDGVTYEYFSVFIYSGFKGILDEKLKSYQLTDNFSNGSYSYDTHHNLFRVNRNIDRYRWDMLLVEPKSLATPPTSMGDFWVADCSVPVLKKFLMCTLEREYLAHIIQISIFGENLKIRDKLFKFLIEYLESKRLK